MPASPTNEETERGLRRALDKKGFTLSEQRGYGETGVDILAEKGGKKYHIEVIGFKSSAPARSKDFFESFFRAVSRLEVGAMCCVIALPKRFAAGFPQRVRQYATAWKRIAVAFPELEIWLVDVNDESFEVTRWGDWIER